MMNLDSMKALFVDDEPRVVSGYQRALRKVINCDTCTSGSEALEHLEKSGPYAVIVSDMRMPQMDGVELLKQVRKLAPDTVRIMLTGNADQATAVDAINEGDVFRFLNKPCEPKLLAEAVLGGFQKYQAKTAEKELLGKTLTGAVEALAETLAMANPAAWGRIARLQTHLRAISDVIRNQQDWELDVLATLSQVGSMVIDDSLLLRDADGQALAPEEQRAMVQFAELGGTIVGRIPRLENIAAATRMQRLNFSDRAADSSQPQGKDIPLMARLLHVMVDYDVLSAAQGSTPMRALSRLQDFAYRYDPDLLRALEPYAQASENASIREIQVVDLAPGMLLATDIVTSQDKLLARSGQTLTEASCERLRVLARHGVIPASVGVFATISTATNGSFTIN
ncbi:MAG: response regulator [Gammaproteobacteria bacterium]|nr:response regulator [Gammaproteobacteria bacterium]